MVSNLKWLGEDQRTFLERGYLDNQTPEERYQEICDTIQEICHKQSFVLGETIDEDGTIDNYERLRKIGERFERYIENGWVSFSTPVLKNFGRKDNLPISCNKSILDDSLDDIYKGLHEIGILAKNGAGTSECFSKIRPIGSNISTGGKSNSVLDWVELYADLMSKTAQNCYKDNVEILTNSGWKLFSDLKSDDFVASVLDNDTVEFVKPTAYFDYDFNGDLIKFKDSKNIDISVTDNHNMVFKRRNRISGAKSKDGKYISNEKVMDNWFSLKEAKMTPTHRDIFMYKSSGSSIECEGLSYKERLLIAFQADGSISSKNCIRFHFSKKKKIDRLRIILENLDYKFSEIVLENGNVKFHVNCRETLSKNFDWVNLDKINEDWGKEFLHELSQWDSSVENNKYDSFQYFSVNKLNIDIVQAICSLSNYSSTYTIKRPKNNIQHLHVLYISSKKHFGLEKMKPVKEHYEGKVYCVEVPSNKIIVRSNGRTLVCGNSARRGFLTAYLSLDHPEIMDFLDIGTRAMPEEKQRFFQTITTGVTIPVGWRQSLKDGDPEKRKIWAKVLKTRKEIGFPYIIDLENCNNTRPLVYVDKGLFIETSNICTEIIEYCDIEKTFACCLSSANAYYFDEWKGDPDFIFDMNIMLDCVIEEYIEKASKINGLQKAVKFAKEHRAIGLGILGFHSYLQKKMISFGSLESYQVNNSIFRTIRIQSDKASKWMAKNWGEPEIMNGYGLRNSTRIAQAPTKSTSFIMGGYSEGIEPYVSNYNETKKAKIQVEFKNSELEKLLKLKSKNTREVWKSIEDQNGSVQHLDFLTDHEKDVFKTFSEISQVDVIKLAAQRQKFIDQGQSLNIMIHPQTSAKDINRLHMLAFDSGIKSLYYQHSINAAQEFSRDLLECSSCEG